MKRVAAIEINTCPHYHGYWRVVEQSEADVLALRGLLVRPDIGCRGPPWRHRAGPSTQGGAGQAMSPRQAARAQAGAGCGH